MNGGRLRLVFGLVAVSLAAPLPVAGTTPGVATRGATRLIPPRTVVLEDGSLAGSVGAVAARDQRGSQDDPERYLRLVPDRRRFDVRFTYRTPVPPAPAVLDLAASLRGHGGWWRLKAWDREAGRWRTLAGNDGAVPGRWAWRSHDLDPDRVLDGGGRLRVRIVGGGGPLDVDLLAGRRTVWQPAPGTSWQWQLTGRIDTTIDVEMYDVDLFDAPAAVLDTLHDDGRIVVCYFSAGAWEDWRPDAGDYPDEILGNSNGWPGERWLDVRRLDLLAPVIGARLDLAAARGCDGVEPDNVDGYANSTGFPLTYRDQARFNRWLARIAHRRHLSVGLKNDLDQVPALVGRFDWALDEQCFEYDECRLLEPFVAAGKAVFGVEYAGKREEFCPESRRLGFSWLLKRYDLGAWARSC